MNHNFPPNAVGFWLSVYRSYCWGGILLLNDVYRFCFETANRKRFINDFQQWQIVGIE